jgi:hypothetical protein
MTTPTLSQLGEMTDEELNARLAECPVLYSPEWYDMRIDCAAIKCGGLVWTGKRHGHCIATVKQATGKRANEFPDEVQGFVTMSGRFVDRKEAAELVKKTGQVQLKHSPTELYSEDLY